MKKEQLYDIIVKYLPIGFSVVDKNGSIIDFNQAERTAGKGSTFSFALPKDKQ